jgi:hypothetical protein
MTDNAKNPAAPKLTVPPKNTAPAAKENSRPPDDPEKVKARREKKKAAVRVIQAAIKDKAVMALFPVELDNVREALKALFVRTRDTGATFTLDGVMAMFSKLEIGAGLDELELFKQFKIGRGEMRKVVRNHLNDAPLEQRVWVEFLEKEEKWTVKGKGPDAPEGWKGHKPTAKEAKAEKAA